MTQICALLDLTMERLRAEFAAARGRAYYLLHSPTDFIPMSMPEQAREALGSNGAQVRLQTYEGGHGWHGHVFGNIRAGVQWLEKSAGTD